MRQAANPSAGRGVESYFVLPAVYKYWTSWKATRFLCDNDSPLR